MKLNYWYYGACHTLEGTALELLEKLVKLLNDSHDKGLWELKE